MGPVAAIYDIHGNLPALEAVLGDIRRADVDVVVIGGDVLPGPMIRETLACLNALDLPTRFIRGNGDRVVLEARPGATVAGVPERYQETLRWVASQLTAQDERAIAAWPETLSLDLAGLGRVLFCHATPRNDTEIFTRATPADRLLAIFDELDASIVVCGHTHMPFDRMIGKTRVVNAGSVGMPFGAPGAHWLLLGPTIEFRNTAYDLERAAERIRRTRYPQAEEFANDLPRPRSESEMLEIFARAELR